MKVSTKGRYALRIMIDLAQNDGEGAVSLKDIAQRQEVSAKYLELIVATLNKAGFVSAPAEVRRLPPGQNSGGVYRRLHFKTYRGLHVPRGLPG